MQYRERRTPVPGVVLWHGDAGPAETCRRILPDGCLDLIWDGRRLFVAGPDRTARAHRSVAGTRYWALRFAGGTGPALLGVPADELVDRCPDLAGLWPQRDAAELTGRVAESPAAALVGWLAHRAGQRTVDPLGRRVLAMAGAGLPVSAMADRLGMSARQLHRRALPAFGYGPRRLARVVRMRQALDTARAGVSLAEVAARCGYSDQAHLSRDVRELAGTSPRRLLRELVEGS